MSETPSKWAAPQEKISGAEVLYGTKRLDDFLPKYEEIPPEFLDSSNIWQNVYYTVISRGWEAVTLNTKPGINPVRANHHIVVILRAVLPEQDGKIGYKIGAVAWLLSQWYQPPVIKDATKAKD